MQARRCLRLLAVLTSITILTSARLHLIPALSVHTTHLAAEVVSFGDLEVTHALCGSNCGSWLLGSAMKLQRHLLAMHAYNWFARKTRWHSLSSLVRWYCR